MSFPPPVSRAISSPESTRERIQTQAARLFVASGYHGVSMREVAEAVGVTKPALYHHYADKEALFLAILQGALASLSRLVSHAQEQPTIRAQLETLMHDLLETAPEQRVGLQLASELRHVSPERRHAFETEYRQVWMGGLTTLITGAAERGELRRDLPPPVLTRTLLALTYPLVSGPPMSDPHRTAAALLTIYLVGAGPQTT